MARSGARKGPCLRSRHPGLARPSAPPGPNPARPTTPQTSERRRRARRRAFFAEAQTFPGGTNQHPGPRAGRRYLRRPGESEANGGGPDRAPFPPAQSTDRAGEGAPARGKGGSPKGRAGGKGAARGNATFEGGTYKHTRGAAIFRSRSDRPPRIRVQLPRKNS